MERRGTIKNFFVCRHHIEVRLEAEEAAHKPGISALRSHVNRAHVWRLRERHKAFSLWRAWRIKRGIPRPKFRQRSVERT